MATTLGDDDDDVGDDDARARARIEAMDSPEWTASTNAREVVRQTRVAIPVSVSALSVRARDLISVAFVGRASARDEFAGAALAVTINNVTGLSLVVGAASAVNTLAGRAFGAGDYGKTGRVGRRACASLCAMSVAIGIVWWFCAEMVLFGALGQRREIARAAQRFIRGLAPGLVAYAANAATQAFLQSQEVTRPQVIGGIIATAMHAPMCWFLVYPCGLGYVGAAVATSCGTTFALGVNVAYIALRRSVFRESDEALAAKRDACATLPDDWFEDLFDLDGAKEFLSLALPGIVLMSEWWASELLILFAGWLKKDPEIAVAAMSIYQVTNSFAFMIAVGFGVATVTRVSHELGAGNGRAAKFSALVALRLILIVELFVSTTVLFSRHIWGSLFTDDKAVTALLSQLMVVLAVYVAFDALCCVSTAALRGCGRQAVAAPVVVFSYYIVGVPSALLLGFKTSLGVHGLAIGGLLGTATHAIAMTIMVLRVDWSGEVVRARASHAVDQLLPSPSVELVVCDGDKHSL